MPEKFARNLFVAAVAAASLTVGWPGSATAATAPPSAHLSDARIVQHFDLAGGRMPENIALEPDGSVDLAFSAARQIARVTRDGSVRVLATLPAPADGGTHTPALGFPLVTGLVRDAHGTLYLLYATGTAELTGVWRLTPGGAPERIAALPADGLPNGLALDSGLLYVTDSVRGEVRRVPAGGGDATLWADGPELAPAGFLGANGLKIHNGAVWVSNMDRGTLLRIPLRRNGTAGPAETRAEQLPGIDDFAFVGRGDRIVAALDQSNQVALVEPDGTHSIVLGARDGLQNPTAVAVRGDTVYVTSAAYLTEQDPNLLTARIRPRG
ncbi:SMP-30/gluconolactonase/LRE family protein [Kitasatospora sp. NPDC057223]|uniref:SMP-30/gluconolactonase/LRE family protein n=1 Tax=Kitasatospora sp. NPDC057223 TaxID=3346055 RepID=UPI003629B1C4